MTSPRTFLPFISALLALLLLSSCSRLGQDVVSGYLYTNITVPYTVDLDNTPVGRNTGQSRTLRIKEPFTDVGIYTELNSNAIGDIARKNGMNKVYFADMETFSVLSIWKTNTLILYGE